MERGRGGRDGPFGTGDPFAGFGRLGATMPDLFGEGRDPFDDPFFTQPFGTCFGRPGMFGPMGGPSLFGPTMLGGFGPGDGFLEQAPARSGDGGGPVITEIDEDEDGGDGEASRGAYVQEPDDGNDDGMQQGGKVQLRRDPNRANGGGGQPQSHSFTYRSSTVTYGGINGAYYTASKTRRRGNDVITVEETKETDTTTKEATHRISRGIHDKTSKLDIMHQVKKLGFIPACFNL
ncbi:glycine-rich protein-like [Hordeum vulgare]|nr:glycine-rich protein-like [Hordeum vulgare]